MKIAIIGYGKMGHAIEKVALSRGHEIVAVIDAHNVDEIDSDLFATADAAIEFTTPATAAANVERAARRGVPVVCGSTGWYDRLSEVSKAVEEAGSALLTSSNFSIGVYVTRLVARKLAAIMGNLPQYTPELVETHHIHKLDYPSGTALTMAQDVVGADDRLTDYVAVGEVRVEDDNVKTVAPEGVDVAPGTLPVLAIRRGEVPGIHTLSYDSEVDTITLTHEAKSRGGFALGAVMAAEWIAGRKGCFTIDDFMSDLLKTTER